MKFKELLQMNREEQDKKIKELELELIKLNAQVATGTPPKNTGQLKRLKKDLSRLILLKSLDEKKAIQPKAQQPKATKETKSQDKKTNEKVNKKTK